MIRRFHFLLAGCIALSAMIASCTSELENPEVDITSIRCSISPIDVEEDFATGALDTLQATRAVFSGTNFLWSAGDKIGIVPNKGAHIYFSVENGAGTSTAAFDGGDWAMKSSGTFYAYYPLYPDIFLTKEHVPVSYTGQTQSGNNNNLHTGSYWTLYTEGTKAVGNALNFSFDHLTSFFKTYVTVPAGTYTRITFTAPSKIFIKDGYFDLGAQTPKIVGTNFTNELSLELQDVTFTEETELSGYLVVAPIDIAGIPITVTVYKEGAPAYEYTLTKTSSMVASKTYAFRATTLTPVVSSVDEANALFASGTTSVTVSEPVTEDTSVILPNTEDAVTLTLPSTPSSSTLTLSYGQEATAFPVTLSFSGPEDANLIINVPNSTVTVDGVSYNHVTSRTETNIISIDVTVNVLTAIQGDVQVYGTVKQIDLSEQEDEGIIYSATGTVNTLLGEDDEEYIPAVSMSLNKSSISLAVGASETLTASVLPLGAYPKVVWRSSDETVATVSADGVVTAVAGGSATITAKTISGGYTASCAVSVNDPMSETSMINYYACGVFSDHSDIYLFGDDMISHTNGFGWGTRLLKENWLSAVAFIGDNRYELGATDGFTRLTTSGGNPEEEVQYGKYTWCWAFKNTTVQSALKVASTNSPVTIIMTDVNGNEYTLVYTKPQTSSIISTYYKYGGEIPSVSVSGVEISPEIMTLQTGDTTQLTATVLPVDASNRTVIWTSSNESVATVSSSGLVVGVRGGTSTITCTTNDGGFTASCSVTVRSFPEGNAFDEDAYITYVSNHQEWFNMSTDRSYVYDTNFSANVTGTRFEMKFQIPEDSSKKAILSYGSGVGLAIDASNVYYYYDERYHEDGDTWYDREYLSGVENVSGTGVVVLTASCDGDHITVSVKGKETTIPQLASSLGIQYLFSDYDSQSGDGSLYEYLAGVPDGAKLYYVKIWNGNDLLYFGHASRAIYSATQEEEYCWYEEIGNKYTFARSLHTLTSSEITPYNPSSPIATVRQPFGGGID